MLAGYRTTSPVSCRVINCPPLEVSDCGRELDLASINVPKLFFYADTSSQSLFVVICRDYLSWNWNTVDVMYWQRWLDEVDVGGLVILNTHTSTYVRTYVCVVMYVIGDVVGDIEHTQVHTSVCVVMYVTRRQVSHCSLSVSTPPSSALVSRHAI